MIELNLSIKVTDTGEEDVDIQMDAEASGIDTDTKLTFYYRESILGDWIEAGEETINENGAYNETVTGLDKETTYSFKVSLRQPPTGAPDVQLESNIVAYIGEEDVEDLDAYTTVEKVRENTDANEDEAKNLVKTVTKWIDNYTNRSFIGDTDTRKYDGNNRISIIVDDFKREPVVKRSLDYYGEELEEIDDYVLLPANAEKKKQPYTGIHLKTTYFYRGLQNVEITATFGYSESPPEDIINVATRLAVLIYNKSTRQARGVKQEKIGDFQISYDDKELASEMNSIKGILDYYKKFTI